MTSFDKDVGDLGLCGALSATNGCGVGKVGTCTMRVHSNTCGLYAILWEACACTVHVSLD